MLNMFKQADRPIKKKKIWLRNQILNALGGQKSLTHSDPSLLIRNVCLLQGPISSHL